jgi:hypothetical protein
VDNKANILLAVEGVLLGSLTYAVNEIFLTQSASTINTYGYIILGGAFILFTIIALLLIHAIRPAKYFFGLKVPFKKMKVDNYVMWYDKDFPSTADKYINIIKKLNVDSIKNNYYKQHFISLQLVRNKYTPYMWATLGMKLLVIWTFVGVLLLVVLKFHG